MLVKGNTIRYEAGTVDSGIPLHSHEPDSIAEHTTICVVGSIAVFVYPDTVLIAKAGDPPLSWDKGLWHGVMPLEEGAVWINVMNSPTQDDIENIIDSQHNAPKWALAKLGL